MIIHVFDLDGTVIDSKHRQLTDDSGNLCLDHWRENCTPEKIAADTLLPLADHWRKLYQQGECIAICTARVMSRHDWQFLGRHNLSFHHAYTRIHHDRRGDAEMKREKLRALCATTGTLPRDVVLYEDNKAVLSMARKMGITVIDSVIANRLAVAEFDRRIKQYGQRRAV